MRTRPASKINRREVLALAKVGLTPPQIAKHQGVSPSTIFRFLQREAPEREAVELFKVGRADVLAGLQAKSLDLQEKIVDSLREDGVLAALTAREKSGLLIPLNAISGTAFDKERLERGQSTANHSLVAKIMGSALDSAFKQPQVTHSSHTPPLGASLQSADPTPSSEEAEPKALKAGSISPKQRRQGGH